MNIKENFVNLDLKMMIDFLLEYKMKKIIFLSDWLMPMEQKYLGVKI